MIFEKPRAVHTLMSFAAALVLFLPITGTAQTQDFADPSASSVTKRMLPRSGSPDRSVRMTTNVAGRKTRSFAEMLAAVSASTSSQKLPRFVAHRDYLAADGPQNIAMGDLNGDGIADLIVNDGNTSNISLLLGNRNGGFQPLKLINAAEIPAEPRTGHAAGGEAGRQAQTPQGSRYGQKCSEACSETAAGSTALDYGSGIGGTAG